METSNEQSIGQKQNDTELFELAVTFEKDGLWFSVKLPKFQFLKTLHEGWIEGKQIYSMKVVTYNDDTSLIYDFKNVAEGKNPWRSM